jgi:hypothetical protein
MADALFIEAVRTTDKLKNKAGCSMNGHSARNKWARLAMFDFWPNADMVLSKILYRCAVERR